MSIAQRDTEIKTWATLDESNKAHYQRRPKWVLEAEAASQVADMTHNITLDLWLDNSCTWETVDLAERSALAYYEHAQDCRQSWHAGLDQPALTLADYLSKHGVIDINADGEITERVPFCYGLPD